MQLIGLLRQLYKFVQLYHCDFHFFLNTETWLMLISFIRIFLETIIVKRLLHNNLDLPQVKFSCFLTEIEQNVFWKQNYRFLNSSWWKKTYRIATAIKRFKEFSMNQIILLLFIFVNWSWCRNINRNKFKEFIDISVIKTMLLYSWF